MEEDWRFHFTTKLERKGSLDEALSNMAVCFHFVPTSNKKGDLRPVYCFYIVDEVNSHGIRQKVDGKPVVRSADASKMAKLRQANKK